MTRSGDDDELARHLKEAVSPSWSRRAASGRRLASLADIPGIAQVLHQLLLDANDTFVTQETAEALLARWDLTGLRLVLAASAVADDDCGDHLHAAVLNVCGQSEEGGERFASLCADLVSDADPAVGREARRYLEPTWELPFFSPDDRFPTRVTEVESEPTSRERKQSA